MKMNKVTLYAFLIIKRMSITDEILITSKYIAEAEQLSHGITMKILSTLRGAGIVVSHQGRGKLVGGFSLVRNAKEVSIYELLTVMEGGFSLCPVTDQEDLNKSSVIMYQGLGCMNDVLVEALKRYSVFDLLISENPEKKLLMMGYPQSPLVPII